MLIQESMLQPSVSGTLFVQDKGSYGESINFVGGEIFEITIKTPVTEADDNLEFPNDQLGLVSSNNLVQNLKFHIHRVQTITDDATLEIDAQQGPATMWMLEFGPYELTLFNKTDPAFYNGEFIGKIADEDGEGLMNYFADRYFNPSATENSSSQEPMDIEPTLNAVWLKGNNASYPGGRRTSHLELGRLINYVVENSVSENNPSAVNYMFWQDLNKWHFRSVDSLINEQQSPRTYKISTDKNGKDVLTNFMITKQLDQSELINSDAYKAFYVHVEPNYDDPYSSYMPVNDKIKRERIDYDYTVDYDSWSHVESNQVLPDSLKYDNSDANEIEDDINGWFSVDEYNDYSDTKFDYYKNDNHKNTMKCWQTNFDQTDLDYELLKKIRNGVILPAKYNYDLYVKKRLLKEKWNVYKYAICCDKQAIQVAEGGGGARILGCITGFERYSLPGDTAGEGAGRVREIWKYNWAPVEMWPTEEVFNQDEVEAGITYNDEGNTYEIVGQQGPFTVVKLPQQPGVTLEAYNLNELTNQWDRDYYNDSNYIGPGYNAQHLQIVNGLYDKAFSRDPIDETVQSQFYMPIGGKLIQTSAGGMESRPINLTYVGVCRFEVDPQLVELFEIPNDLSILGKTGAEGTTQGPSESIYLFNKENAVDGSCIPCILGTYSEGQETGDS
tara:strand:- start:141 stop:2153 length:2013 start_codon:yes stop_codon:yes gene_type:complete